MKIGNSFFAHFSNFYSLSTNGVYVAARAVMHQPWGASFLGFADPNQGQLGEEIENGYRIMLCLLTQLPEKSLSQLEFISGHVLKNLSLIACLHLLESS